MDLGEIVKIGVAVLVPLAVTGIVIYSVERDEEIFNKIKSFNTRRIKKGFSPYKDEYGQLYFDFMKDCL